MEKTTRADVAMTEPDLDLDALEAKVKGAEATSRVSFAGRVNGWDRQFDLVWRGYPDEETVLTLGETRGLIERLRAAEQFGERTLTMYNDLLALRPTRGERRLVVIDLKALRSAAEAATPGPWWAMEEGLRPEDGPTCFRITNPALGGAVMRTSGYSEGDANNAGFITLANPAAIIELIDAYERLAEVVDHHRSCPKCGCSREDVIEAIAEARAALTQAPEAP